MEGEVRFYDEKSAAASPIFIFLALLLYHFLPKLSTTWQVIFTVLLGLLTLGHFYMLYDRKKFPLIASPTGLIFQRMRRQPEAVAWPEILEIESVNHGGFISINRNSRNGRPQLLISRRLEDQRGFYDYVSAHAPAGNPLRVWIEALPERNLLIHKK